MVKIISYSLPLGIKSNWMLSNKSRLYALLICFLNERALSLSPLSIFNKYSPGVATSRDPWVYNYSRRKAFTNLERMVGAYNHQVANIVNEDGDTALILAAFYGHVTVVELLLADERVVNPNKKNIHGLNDLSLSKYKKNIIGMTMWLSGKIVKPGETVISHVQRGYPLKEVNNKMKKKAFLLLPMYSENN